MRAVISILSLAFFIQIFKYTLIDATFFKILSFITDIGDNGMFLIFGILLIFKHPRLIFSFFLFFYYYVFFDNIFIFKNYEIILAVDNININLLNGLFIIHPFLVYSFYFFYINYTFEIFTQVIPQFSNLKSNLLLFYNRKYLILLIVLIFLAIFLGCWWAFQELNWGSWWNWDLVEVINLVLFLIALNFTHKSTLQNFNLEYFLFNLVLIFLFWISVRYTLLRSIHNFISEESLQQFTSYILVFIYIICIYILLNFCRLNILANKYKLFFKKIISPLIFYVYIFILLIIFNLIVTIPKEWYDFSIIYLKNFCICIFNIYLYIYISKFKLLYNLIFSTYLDYIYIFTILKFYFNYIKLNRILHAFILLFMLLVLLYYFNLVSVIDLLNLETMANNLPLIENLALNLFNFNYLINYYSLIEENYTTMNFNLITNSWDLNTLDEINTQLNHSLLNNSIWLEYTIGGLDAYWFPFLTKILNLFILVLVCLLNLFIKSIRKIYY